MKSILIIFTLLIPTLTIGQLLYGSKNPIIGGIPVPPVEAAYTTDLDNDGDSDILVISDLGSSQEIIWFRNNNNSGSFDAPIVLLTDINDARDIFVADIDGDNDLDILSNADDDGHIFWLENIDGNGVFSSPVMIPVSGTVNQIYAIDLDADGDQDIVAQTPEVIWFENLDGMGSFGTQQNIVGEGSFRFGDIDTDGDMDLLTFSTAESVIKWYPNQDGQGTFGDEVSLATLAAPKDVLIADINADNNPDLVVSTSNSIELAWYENEDGNGSFGVAKTISAGTVNCALAKAADFDNDGDLDIVANLYDWGATRWFENLDGLGNFGPAQNLTGSTDDRQALILEDLNGDSFIDILMGFQYGDYYRLVWYENLDGTDDFSQQQSIYIEAYGAFDILAVDINGDGHPDCVGASISDDKIAWYENENGQGDFGTQQIISIDADSPWSIAAEDMDNDGDMDILSASRYDDKIAWYENETGLGDFSTQQVISTELIEPTSISPADLNGDGHMDILCISDEDDKIAWFNNQPGTGDFSAPLIIAASFPYIKTVMAIDIDNDTDLDIVAGGSQLLAWYENEDGQGSFGAEQIIRIDTTNISVGNLSAGDIDLDGDIDIVSTSTLLDDISWYENEDGNGNFSDQQIAATGFRFSSAKLVDVDNDNDLDIIFSSQSLTSLWIGGLENTDGEGTFGPIQTISAEVSSFGIVHYASVDVADFNGDELPDILGSSAWSNEIVWHQNLLNYPVISGQCFIDYNENQIKDNDEVAWFSQRVNLSPEAIGNFSGPDGEYLFVVEDGNYTASATPDEGWYLTTASNYTITIQNEVPVTGLDFGFAPNEITSSVKPGLSAGPTRCGLTVPFWVSYKNTGTTFTSGFVAFQFDDLSTLVNTEIQPDSVAENTLFWHFNNLPPTYGENIQLSLQMPGVESIGDTLYFQTSTYLTDAQGNTTLSEIYPAQYVISCAYDPNDKLVNPVGINEEHLTPFGQELEYTVRFQNTGTDTAFLVRIEDQLDNNLDWTSFRPVAASHPYEVNIFGNGLVEFTFHNINLPDSSANEVKSHGFLKYRIMPLDNLPESTTIHNTANIFFDFNPPITTNTTLNTLVSDITSIAEVSNQITIHVSPNPATNELFLTLHGITDFKNTAIDIVDINGRLIGNQSLHANTTRINIEAFAKGIYFYRIKNDNLYTGRGKFIKL